MHSYKLNELIQLLESNSNTSIDRQLIGQLYNKCIQDNQECTIPTFESVYRNAIQLLGQKITKSRMQLEEEKDNLQSIEERMKTLTYTPGNNRIPMRLQLHSASVLNLQVLNKFMVGQYAFYVKVEDYYEYESEFRPSYNLQFSLNQAIDIKDVGDSILFALNTNLENQMNTTIVIPAYSLQFSKIVTELFTQKEMGELLEVEVKYEIKILDYQLVMRQLEQSRTLTQSYVKKFADEMEDYELQLQDLRGIRIPTDVPNEMNDPRNHIHIQEPSHNTYTIGVPDYYHKPLDLQSQDYQQTPQPQRDYSKIIPYIIGIMIGIMCSIEINVFYELSLLMIVLIIVIKEDHTTILSKIIIVISWIVFGLLLWQNANTINTKQSKICWLGLCVLQFYKIYLIFL